ncbi:MAG: hypothetical protein ABRQ39_31710, partial [Candidatus Eremiobacterota bacterium]
SPMVITVTSLYIKLKTYSTCFLKNPSKPAKAGNFINLWNIETEQVKMFYYQGNSPVLYL